LGFWSFRELADSRRILLRNGVVDKNGLDALEVEA